MEKISRVETFPNLVASKEPATVYDVACKSIPELVYLIMQRLNETIEHMNKNDATLQQQLDYVLAQLEDFYLKFDEDLRQEIQIVLQAWIEDGTLEQVISQLVENRAVYPSIAALQQAPNIFQLGAIVELQGYHYAGDGAGHKRIIADVDDGSGVAVGNKWANVVYSDRLNISVFGVMKDLVELTERQCVAVENFRKWCRTLDFNGANILVPRTLNLTNFHGGRFVGHGTIRTAGENFAFIFDGSKENYGLLKRMSIEDIDFRNHSGSGIDGNGIKYIRTEMTTQSNSFARLRNAIVATGDSHFASHDQVYIYNCGYGINIPGASEQHYVAGNANNSTFTNIDIQLTDYPLNLSVESFGNTFTGDIEGDNGTSIVYGENNKFNLRLERNSRTKSWFEVGGNYNDFNLSIHEYGVVGGQPARLKVGGQQNEFKINSLTIGQLIEEGLNENTYYLKAQVPETYVSYAILHPNSKFFWNTTNHDLKCDNSKSFYSAFDSLEGGTHIYSKSGAGSACQFTTDPGDYIFSFNCQGTGSLLINNENEPTQAISLDGSHRKIHLLKRVNASKETYTMYFDSAATFKLYDYNISRYRSYAHSQLKQTNPYLELLNYQDLSAIMGAFLPYRQNITICGQTILNALSMKTGLGSTASASKNSKTVILYKNGESVFLNKKVNSDGNADVKKFYSTNETYTGIATYYNANGNVFVDIKDVANAMFVDFAINENDTDLK